MSIPFILLLGGGFAFLLITVGVVISITSERSLVDQRIGKYVEEEIESEDDIDSSVVADWLNVQVERSSWGERIARDLARADLKLKPAEYIALMLISSAFVGFLFWFFGGRIILVAVIGVLVGSFLPRIYVRRQQNQRLVNFSEQLPDMLNLMVNGLRAGFSTMQAMEAVSNELPAPLSDEFHRLVQEMQLGLPMERALSNLYRRIPSDDLDLIIAAMNVQRDVGGNLAEVLDTISYTIRERVRIKGEIRVLTSQVMYSGRFLALLPLILSGVLWFVNRSYMMTFFQPNTRICGFIMLGIAGLMVAIGYFVMTRIAQIEV